MQILITCFHVLTLESDFDRLFHSIDADGDQHISFAELNALIIGIQFDEINLDQAEATEKLMKDFDTSLDRKIQLSEFIEGVSRWIGEAKRSGDSSNNAGPNTVKYLDNFHQVCCAHLVILIYPARNSSRILMKSCLCTYSKPRESTICWGIKAMKWLRVFKTVRRPLLKQSCCCCLGL